MLCMTFSTKQRTLFLAKWRLARPLFLLLMLFLFMTACASEPGVSLKQAIVGKWVNAENYSIEFYADGTGFAPGVEGQMPIPAMDFSYFVTDETHIRITMGDLVGAVVEIKIEGDQMTWLDRNTDTAFVYTRSK
jgi:hypothetical protein